MACDTFALFKQCSFVVLEQNGALFLIVIPIHPTIHNTTYPVQGGGECNVYSIGWLNVIECDCMYPAVDLYLLQYVPSLIPMRW